jgi:hypothetical protein
MGVEEYARRKYKEYENNLEEERKRNLEVANDHKNLINKNQENDKKLQ